MTEEQYIIVFVGMLLSLYFGFRMGWNSAFKKVDKIIEDYENGKI